MKNVHVEAEKNIKIVVEEINKIKENEICQKQICQNQI